MKNFVTLGFCIIPLLLAGCGGDDEEIRVYQISRPANAPAAQTAGPATAPAPTPTERPARAPASVNPSSSMTVLPGMQESAAQIETPDWTTPEAWEELPPTAIRKGNFRITEPGRIAEITVTAFPGNVGGLEANLNRWRRQIDLPPEPMVTLREDLEEIEIDGLPAHYVELIASPGAQSNGIAGAVIPRGSHTWFVKMVGDTTLLQEQQPNLRLFLQSIRF